MLATYAIAINNTITIPIQNPEKLPDTIPDSIVKDEPPSFDAVTTSSVCFAFGDVNIFVNSGIKAAPNVPQDMIHDNINQILLPISANNHLLTPNVINIESMEVIQTSLVKGASKSNFSTFGA